MPQGLGTLVVTLPAVAHLVMTSEAAGGGRSILCNVAFSMHILHTQEGHTSSKADCKNKAALFSFIAKYYL